MKTLRFAFLGLCSTFVVMGSALAAEDGRAAAGVNDFGLKVYRELAKGGDGSLFFSPPNISLALTLVGAGAKGETGEEMRAALGQSGGTAGEWAERMGEMQRGLMAEREGKKSVLRLANALWVQAGYPLEAGFKKIAEKRMDAGAEEVDFVNSAVAAGRINGWVEKRTEGRIRDLVPADSLNGLTKLVVTSAVYFKDAWATPFPAGATKDEPFFALDGAAGTLPLMRRTGRMGYAAGAGWRAVELDCQFPGLGMVVVLPEGKGREGLAGVEKGLEGILVEVGRGKSGMVNLVLPRFRLEESVALKPLLVGLGMRRAFGDEADFTGISPRAARDGLYVSEVLHKAFVEVNEEGAEAAAATGVVMATRSAMRPEEPVEFRANRPFVFLIRDRMTGTTLFLGRFMGK